MTPLGALRWCDTQVQRLHDSHAHAVMRRWGLSKYQLRRIGWTVYALVMLGTPFTMPTRTTTELMASAFLAFSMFCSGLGTAEVVGQADARAERTGLRSNADRWGWFWKVTGFTVLALPNRGWLSSEVCQTAVCTLVIAQGYLCNTDPTPPPKKETAPAALQPETT
jgi:hypothetical protein